MGSFVTVSTCSLNQWSLDLLGNRDRILEACRVAKAQDSALIVTPELSITGYGCLDHFLERDLHNDCWDILIELLQHEDTQGIVVDVGMPVSYDSAYYNCRVIFYNGKIIMVRPKMSLANDGLFREMRYFTPWTKPREVESLQLPPAVRKITGQESVAFGDGIYRSSDGVMLGVELCEELWVPNSPSIHMGLRGVEIFTNASGSHHQLRKLSDRIRLITAATHNSGGIYLYANQRGCDGDRALYDGCSMIVVNGNLVKQGRQFALQDVEVITATVDLEEVRSYRSPPSRRMQAASAPSYPILSCGSSMASKCPSVDSPSVTTTSVEPYYIEPSQEIALGPALWLWDYLRRSNQAGYFLPLSGGIDSCATAVIVASMTREVYKAITEENNEQVLKDCLRICDEAPDSTWRPKSPQEIAGRLFHTCYMGMEKNSSRETRQRAKELAAEIGSYHVDMNIDIVVGALTTLLQGVLGFALRYKTSGGRPQENLALQNLQSRSRMVIAYAMAMTLPLKRGRKGPGGLLVLGSANVGESLRGYYTKYDNSSADLNPIGSISKLDLRAFIGWAQKAFSIPVLGDFLDATPTAELEPISNDYVQSDEVDMGMSYKELDIFGRLRKTRKLGPYGVWQALRFEWPELSARTIWEKTRHFFFYYGINRHKMTTLTPSYHAEDYSPDDNRFDLRPFLYPAAVNPYEFQKIEKEVLELEAEGKAGGK